VSYSFWISPLLTGLALLMPLSAPGETIPTSPAALAASQDQAQQHFQQGQLHYSKGNLKAAIEQYTTAIKLNPDFINAYVARGGALGSLEDYSAAIDDYTVAINLAPDLAGAYGGRGLARFRNGDDEGIHDLWQAARLYREQHKMNDYFRTLSVIQRLAP
jgi:tetratricopeptide (TPR) repeat protein